ncbi:hypothetical protein DYU11_22915 [Fibrisoma montanum]|uniref:Uncharacterized protein n=1 Tax=Fibrisoma montanum TaxID=2305895 RepID=A0A418M211_9BACT|nr:hypothetical protein DYU11_22915 [Fibrisoma montanum]
MGKSKKASKHKNTTVVIVEKDVSVSFEEFEQVMTTLIQGSPVTNEQLKKKNGAVKGRPQNP